jgi:hypothetical protein
MTWAMLQTIIWRTLLLQKRHDLEAGFFFIVNLSQAFPYVPTNNTKQKQKFNNQHEAKMQ